MDYSEYCCCPNYHLYSFQATQTSGFPPVLETCSTRLGSTSRAGTGSSTSTTGLTALSPTVPSIAIKVINPSKKTEAKMFLLQNIEFDNFKSPESMKQLLVDQLATIVCENVAEMGYFRGNKRIWIRNDEDMKEVQRLLRSKDSHNVTLWCMGRDPAERLISLSQDQKMNQKSSMH